VGCTREAIWHDSAWHQAQLSAQTGPTDRFWGRGAREQILQFGIGVKFPLSVGNGHDGLQQDAPVLIDVHRKALARMSGQNETTA
jgi:hypothetical protein